MGGARTAPRHGTSPSDPAAPPPRPQSLPRGSGSGLQYLQQKTIGGECAWLGGVCSQWTVGTSGHVAGCRITWAGRRSSLYCAQGLDGTAGESRVWMLATGKGWLGQALLRWAESRGPRQRPNYANHQLKEGRMWTRVTSTSNQSNSAI
jgi:hypothetical protein